MRIDYFGVTRQAKKKYTQMMEPICRGHELTENELDVLLFLYNNPEYDRAAEVVVHRGMVKSHVSLSVSALEEKGLLIRVPEPEDRRTVHLKLTEPAKHLAEQGRQVQKQFFTRIFTGLSREDMRLWQTIMEKVCKNIEQLDED